MSSSETSALTAAVTSAASSAVSTTALPVAPRAPRSAARSGRLPLWVPLTLLALPVAFVAGRLANEVEARSLVRVDARCAALERASGAGGDPRWGEELAALVAQHPPFAPDDRAAIEALVADVAAHPAVAEVGTARVLWPDGLDLPLRLRKPAACIRVGGAFLAVSEDAIVLPGTWPTPPWSGEGWLPVIGPDDGALERLRPGDELVEPRHLDALSVALSMRRYLGLDVFEALGPPWIDASTARATSPDEPGTRILLEGGRELRFGRAPWLDAPGELPAEQKWRNLVRALELLARPDGDWDVVDLRWDVPGLHRRGEPEPEPEGSAAR